MKKLSVALAVYNEEKNISRCLSSIQDIADEIVVVDGGSTDNTIEIAKGYNARVIESDNPKVFHINKQKAVSACTGEWVLQLDADEEVSPALATEIEHIVTFGPDEVSQKTLNTLFSRHQEIVEKRDGIKRPTNGPINGFYLARRNFFLGKAMTYAGTYPDGVLRLFRRNKGVFPAKDVHEQIQVEGKVSWLSHDLNHYSNPTLRRYIEGARVYTDLLAKQIEHQNKHIVIQFFLYTLIKPISTFIKLFFRHKGFLDGVHGLLFSLFSSLHFPIGFWKYIQMTRIVALCAIFMVSAWISPIYADYVLPYPSAMPGNKLYKVTQLIDLIQGYWSWGNVAQLSYQQGLADKYLVEAKTLFEYKQYLLASQALQRTSESIQAIKPLIISAYKQGKDVTKIVQTFSLQLETHMGVLEKVKSNVPLSFIWSPENAEETELKLHELIDKIIQLEHNDYTWSNAFYDCITILEVVANNSFPTNTCEHIGIESRETLDSVDSEQLDPMIDSTFKDEEPYL